MTENLLRALVAFLAGGIDDEAEHLDLPGWDVAKAAAKRSGAGDHVPVGRGA
jgi:hypothetical protein